MAARIGPANSFTHPGRGVEVWVGLGEGGNVGVAVLPAVGEGLGSGVPVMGMDGNAGVAGDNEGLHAERRTNMAARTGRAGNGKRIFENGCIIQIRTSLYSWFGLAAWYMPIGCRAAAFCSLL
jgi:hypothetical protein